MRKIAFVIPCYRSENTIGTVIDEICNAMEKLNLLYEIILVNDCSPDHTYAVIQRIVQERKHIIGVNLAKNFGQHAAIMAGFSMISCDVQLVCCLDDDGQNPANEVGKLIDKIDEGFDVVYARYIEKEHSKFRNFGSRVNSKMAEHLLEKPKDLYISSYFIARRFVVDKMLEYKHSYPYLNGLVLRTTHNIANVTVKHRAREIGRSGYTFSKLIALWMNGFTAFSIKPLRIATLMGICCAIGGFFYAVCIIIRRLLNPDILIGWSSVIAAIFVMGGLILFVIGMLGEYIGRIYICINQSPQYVIKDIWKGNESDEG